MPEIVLDRLFKDFGNDCKAADDLSLTVNDGEYLCILGPTGAGKTTCLRMICGLTVPDSGRVLFDGKDMGTRSVSERRATMLSQVYSLFPPMTVYENVMFAPAMKKWPEAEAKQVVKSMINLVHMDSKTQNYPHELSGGQQQRTALARALASDSKVLLLDEPLRALDARLRLELRKELKSMAKEMGLTSIHVTHDQDEALEMADRIAIIRNGKIIQVGTPMEVFGNPKTPFVANFVGRSNIFVGKMLRTEDGFSMVQLKSDHIVKTKKADIPEGTDVVVAVKIGSTKLNRIAEESDKTVSSGYMAGTVERILYEGATITVEVQIEGVGLVSSKLPNRKFDDYSKGDRVTVEWLPDKAAVFDMPEEGLEEELRLD